LALPDKAFNYIDSAIVSIHSSFKMSKELMTKRIISGLQHPKAKILGHPTTRLLGTREPIEIDWDILFGFCKDQHKAIEINAWPERLDLPDRLVKQAIEMGVKLIINTDSHDKNQMNNMRYGVDVARRGWANLKDILNTMEYNKFVKWLFDTK
jgi:DNA polymerase (family X)